MKNWRNRGGALAAALAVLLSLTGCGADIGIIGGADGPTAVFVGDEETESASGWEVLPEDEEADPETASGEEELLYEDAGADISEDGTYNSAEDVSLYLYTYGHLPENYITKNEARELGWSGGSVEKYAPGCAIGGDRFGNREGVLPDGSYHECDIDTIGENSRGAKRLVYSDDGRIYYTEDHYETFALLYGEE